MQPFRKDTSFRRTDIFIRSYLIVFEQTHPFGRNGPNRHIHSDTTSNVRLKSFHSFGPLRYCIRPTSDLNISFILKRNWTCEHTTFLPNGKKIHSKYFSYFPSNRSRLNFISSFLKNSLGLIQNFQQNIAKWQNQIKNITERVTRNPLPSLPHNAPYFSLKGSSKLSSPMNSFRQIQSHFLIFDD